MYIVSSKINHLKSEYQVSQNIYFVTRTPSTCLTHLTKPCKNQKETLTSGDGGRIRRTIVVPPGDAVHRPTPGPPRPTPSRVPATRSTLLATRPVHVVHRKLCNKTEAVENRDFLTDWNLLDESPSSYNPGYEDSPIDGAPSSNMSGEWEWLGLLGPLSAFWFVHDSPSVPSGVEEITHGSTFTRLASGLPCQIIGRY